MSITLDGTNGITTADVTSNGLTVDSTTLVVDETNNRVGIGTSSPSYKLHVVGGQTRIDVSSAGTSLVCLGTGSNFQVDHSVSGYATLLNSGGGLAFSANGSERARIDSSGNLLVGTTSTSPVEGFNVMTPASTIPYIRIGHKIGATSGSYFAGFYYNGTSIGTITQSGTTSTSYNTSSDYRLKNTIAPMTNALAKVALLKPCTYKWNADGSDGEGFIAHELAEVCPQAVTGEKDAVDEDGNPQYQGIDTSFLVATLTAAIQEQQAIIEALTARVSALEANNV